MSETTEVWMVRSYDPEEDEWTDPRLFATRGSSWACMNEMVASWLEDLELPAGSGDVSDTHDATTWVLHDRGDSPMVVAERVEVKP